MKNRKMSLVLSLLVLVVGVTFLFVGCGKHKHNLGQWQTDESGHYHVCVDCGAKLDDGEHTFTNGLAKKICSTCGYEKDYSEEENFNLWIVGKNYTFDYSGDYTTKDQRVQYEGDKQTMKEFKCESRSGENIFSTMEVYLDKGNGLLKTETDVVVVKKVLDQTVQKTKYFNEHTKDGATTTTSQFVEDDYAKSVAYMSPVECLEGACIEGSKNTINEYIQSVKESFIEENGEEPTSIKFVRNADGSVSLEIKHSTQYKESSITTPGYLTTIYEVTISVKVSDGKIVSLDYVSAGLDTFEDQTQNIQSTYAVKGEIFYEFDQTTFDSFVI